MLPQLRVQRPKYCAVCGLKATGNHYEVDSCTGCKSFFKRSVMVGANYQCKYIGKCFDDWVFGDPIPGCKACRYDRCEKVGMSKSKFQQNTITRSKKQPVLVESRVCDEIHQLKSVDIDFNAIRSCDIPIYYRTLMEYLIDNSSGYSAPTTPHKMATDTQRLSFEILVIIDHMKKYSFYQELCDNDKFILFHETLIMIGSLTKSYFSYEEKSDKMLQYNGRLETRMVLPKHVPFTWDGTISTQCLLPLIRMNISRVEYMILRAIIVANPNIDGLSENGKKLLTNYRNKFTMSLLYHTMAMHQKPDRFASLIGLITLLEHQQKGFRGLASIISLYRRGNIHIPLLDCIQ